MSLRHIQLEKKNAHDGHSWKSREKDKDLRNLKKMELQQKVAEESLAHTKTIHEKVKSQVDGMPKDDGSLQKKKDDLAKEVEQTKRALATQVWCLNMMDCISAKFTCHAESSKSLKTQTL